MTRIGPGWRSLIRPWYKAVRHIKYGTVLPYHRLLDRFRLNDLDEIYDEEYFGKRQFPPYSIIAKEFVDELVERYDPESVIDIGCAIGVYLAEFKQNGVDISGIEGAEKAVTNAIVENVQLADLRDGPIISQTGSLVLCIEVAEHLHPIYADRLVKTISSAVSDGGIAIVSAAEPGQFGTYHVNLQPKSYWIEKFDATGLAYNFEESMRLQCAISERLATEETSWIATSNLMVFHG